MSNKEQSNIDYQAIEYERLSELQKSITQKLRASKEKGDVGSSLRMTVLESVVSGRYDRARRNLKDYLLDKGDYPHFQSRCERLQQHCIELVAAIETKRNFHNLGGLRLAKQQELNEKILGHFEELKQNIKTMERMEREARLEDIRSTTWFIRTVNHSAFFLFCLAFMLELSGGLVNSFNLVFSALVEDVVSVASNFMSW